MAKGTIQDLSRPPSVLEGSHMNEKCQRTFSLLSPRERPGFLPEDRQLDGILSHAKTSTLDTDVELEPMAPTSRVSHRPEDTQHPMALKNILSRIMDLSLIFPRPIKVWCVAF